MGNQMCDICDREEKSNEEEVDVTAYAKAAVDILNAGVTKEIRITSIKLVDALMGRGANNIKIARRKGGPMSKEQVEQIVAMLLVDQYLQEDMHYTPYNVISYIIAGHRSVNKVIMKFFPSNKVKHTNSKKRKKTSNDGDEDSQKSSKKANFDLVISSDSDF